MFRLLDQTIKNLFFGGGKRTEATHPFKGWLVFLHEKQTEKRMPLVILYFCL